MPYYVKSTEQPTMTLAVMQPYIFPYIGYFQLVQAVDTFIFYDDVNYIKGGWINRNKILLSGNEHFLTIPCLKASPNKRINEITFDRYCSGFKKLEKTLTQAYRKAPYYNQIFPLISNILNTPSNSIAILAAESVKQIANYLEINVNFLTSSEHFPETKRLDRVARLILLCERTSTNRYINPIGGKGLYDKTYFKNRGIQLDFLKSHPIEYKQFTHKFIPWLSIIDVLMFNSIEDTKNLLNHWELI